MKMIIKLTICILFHLSLYSMDISIPIQQEKKTITSMADMHAITARLQHFQIVTRKNGINSLVDSLSDSDKQKKTVSKGKEKEKATPMQVGKTYSGSDILNLLDTVSPVLSKFAKEHNLPIPDLVHYGHLLQEYHIDPRAMVEFVKKQHNIANVTPKGHEIRAYQDIKDKDPDRYISLVLGVFKELSDQTQGMSKSSPLSNAHVDILHNQVANQQNTIFQGKIGIVIHALITIGITIWGAYNQVNNSASTPINGTMLT